jgi:hypothetical protein
MNMELSDLVPGREFISGPQYAVKAGFNGLYLTVAGHLLMPRSVVGTNYEYGWRNNTTLFNELETFTEIVGPDPLPVAIFWLESPYTKPRTKCQLCGTVGHAGCSMIIATNGSLWWRANGSILWDSSSDLGQLTTGDLDLLTSTEMIRRR